MMLALDVTTISEGSDSGKLQQNLVRLSKAYAAYFIYRDRWMQHSDETVLKYTRTTKQPNTPML